MNYRWQDAGWQTVSLPKTVGAHLKAAGGLQLKVLLWLACTAGGQFEAAACAAALGKSVEDCDDALQFWVNEGVLCAAGGEGQQAARPVQAAQPTTLPTVPPEPVPQRVLRPAAVKPQMPEVAAAAGADKEFAYLMQTASERLGKALSPSESQTFFYLYRDVGLPAEVILMIVGYAVAHDKPRIRYIEQTALGWADDGITTMAAAEQHLCELQQQDAAWERLLTLLSEQARPTVAQKKLAKKWLFEWKLDEALVRLAHEQCRERTGKFQMVYMDKVLSAWHEEGLETVEQVRAKQGQKVKAPTGDTSYDLDAYENMVRRRVPVAPQQSKGR